MEPRVSLITLGVRDLPRAVRFYRDGFGWPQSSVGDDKKPAQDTEGGGYVGYFVDPEGHPWEVAWNPVFPLNADGAVQLPD